ncbi:TPA: plasmid fertility inhibition factor family protein [Photobacterium damselae]
MKIEKAKFWGSQYIVFTLSLPDGREVYMREALNHHEDSGFIVFVDSARFESVWFKCAGEYSPHLHLARGTKQHRMDDDKFGNADDAFLLSKDSPVKLAFLSVNSYQIPNISFTDGVTRTVWLLAHGASCFPIYVYREKDAQHVHQFVGLRNISFISLQELSDKLSLSDELLISDFFL